MTLLLAVVLTLGEMPREPGVHRLVLERDGHPKVRYAISLPEGKLSSRPLVLSLHPGGHGAPYYGEGFLIGLIEPALRELRPILVAPDCPSSSWTTSESEEAVLALLDLVSETYDVNEDQIAVTGYSMGGMGTWFLVSRHPGKFSAAIPMAGSPKSAELDRVASTPLYAIHSRVDEVVPLGPTEKAIRELQARGAKAELVIVEDIPHFQTPRFRPYLEEAAVWLRALWAK
jgi:predicted peptidase